jgi:hypothetical protein
MSITLNGTTGITSPAIDLTTALPAADGGTGLTSVGTAGNLLTSDGTDWTSVAPAAPASLSTASGSAPSYSARAWVNFNGTGTPAIRASGNVSSITDNGTGDYTVNFTTAMSDANYSVIASGKQNNTTTPDSQGGLSNGTTLNPNTYSTSSVKIAAISSAAAQLFDPIFVNVAIFR